MSGLAAHHADTAHVHENTDFSNLVRTSLLPMPHSRSPRKGSKNEGAKAINLSLSNLSIYRVRIVLLCHIDQPVKSVFISGVGACKPNGYRVRGQSSTM
jgi:hypothetical protein